MSGFARDRIWTQRIESRVLLEKYVHQGDLDIDDVGRAAHQLVLLTAVETIQQSRNGLRKLSPAETDKIVGTRPPQ